jgi:hypothetical protein
MTGRQHVTLDGREHDGSLPISGKVLCIVVFLTALQLLASAAHTERAKDIR